MKNFILLAFTALFLMNCKSSDSIVVSKEQRKELHTWIENRAFEIESHRANPQVSNGLNQFDSSIFGAGNNASSINLISNPNFLRIQNDSVFVHLPYYGTRHMISHRSSQSGGIQVNAEMKNYSSVYQKAKNRTTIKFEAKNTNEVLDFTLTIFDNQNTTINVYSSQRSSISYDGRISAFPKEKE